MEVGTDTHVVDLLGLYHLDALDRRSGEEVGRHLEVCPDCRDAATEVCDTLAALALLSDDRDSLLNRYGALGAAVPPAFPERFAPQAEPEAPESLLRRITDGDDKRRLRFRRRRPAPDEPSSAPTKPADGQTGPVRRDVPPASATPKPVAPPPVAPAPVTPPPVAPPPVAPPPVKALMARVKEEPSPAPRPLRLATEPLVPPVAKQPAPAPSPPLADKRPTSSQQAPRQATTPEHPVETLSPPVPERESLRPAPSSLPPPPALPVAQPARTRPQGPSRNTRPAGRRSHQRKAAVAGLIGLLAVTMTVAGFSMRALLTDPGAGVPTVAVLTAVASATDVDSGADLSVFLTQQSGSVAVRATVNGVEKGVGYQLYGFTFDGRRRPVINWTGRAGVQEITGGLPVVIADISHFTVMRGTRVVVTAYLSRDAGPGVTSG